MATGRPQQQAGWPHTLTPLALKARTRMAAVTRMGPGTGPNSWTFKLIFSAQVDSVSMWSRTDAMAVWTRVQGLCRRAERPQTGPSGLCHSVADWNPVNGPSSHTRPEIASGTPPKDSVSQLLP